MMSPKSTILLSPVFSYMYICHLIARIESLFSQPDKVKFQLRLGQSKPIYEAFKVIRNSSDWDTLSDARKRIVEGGLLCMLHNLPSWLLPVIHDIRLQLSFPNSISSFNKQLK